MSCCAPKRRVQRNRSQKPRAQIVFSVDDYTPKPLLSDNFVLTEYTLPKRMKSVQDRQENYAQEKNEAVKPKLLAKSEILNFDLDVENGISQTLIVNTFHYNTMLTHSWFSPQNS